MIKLCKKFVMRSKNLNINKAFKKIPCFYIMCIVCAIFAILFILIDLFILKNNCPHLSSYLCNFAVESISIIITLTIIQKILEKRNESKEKELERKNIIKHNEIIMIYIDFYKQFFHCVATPSDKRNNNISFPMQFSIKDMVDLYEISGYIQNTPLRPSIELFYIYEKNIRKSFISVINSIEFKYYPKIKELMLEYIKHSVRDDVSDFILNNIKLKEQVRKMFNPTKIEESYKIYKQDKPNLTTPYCILYDLMNTEQDIIVKYLNEIDNIKSQT